MILTSILGLMTWRIFGRAGGSAGARLGVLHLVARCVFRRALTVVLLHLLGGCFAGSAWRSCTLSEYGQGSERSDCDSRQLCEFLHCQLLCLGMSGKSKRL